MTEIGCLFASTAHEILRRGNSFGSTKMVEGYALYESDNYGLSKYNRNTAAMYDQLVEMGNLLKYSGSAYYHKTTSHHHVGHYRKDVYFGLTRKGWEVAPQYLKAYERRNQASVWELKAKNYCDRVASTNPISFEEAYELAKQGVL